MVDIYTRMQATAKRLLAPTSLGGLGQGAIELVRYTEGAEPANPWDPPATPSREITVLDGVARGVSAELIGAPVENGGQIVATDLQVTVAPWGGVAEPADVLEIDGSPVTILSVKNIPAAGTVCAVRFVVRGGAKAGQAVDPEQPIVRRLSGGITGSASLYATFALGLRFTGVVSGLSSAAGTIGSRISLAGAADGSSTLTAAPTITALLSGSVISTAGVSGTITSASGFSGAISGTSQFAATLSGTSSLSGSIVGQCSIAGTVTTRTMLVGAMNGAGAVLGAVTVQARVTGSISGGSAFAGAIAVGANLTGAMPGTSSVVGAVSTAAKLAGASNGVGVTSGTITNTAGATTRNKTMADVPGLVTYHSIADPSTYDMTDGKLTQWRAKQGSTVLNQPDAGRRMTFVPNVAELNNQPAAMFGSGCRMDFDDASMFPQNATGHTILLLYRGTVNKQNLIVLSWGSDTSKWRLSGYGNSGTNTWAVTSLGDHSSTNSALNVNALMVHTLASGANPVSTHYFNGGDGQSLTFSGTADNGATKAAVGWTQFLDIFDAEGVYLQGFAVYNSTLSTADRHDAEAIMAYEHNQQALIGSPTRPTVPA